jgi:predicted nucleotidyltransferase
VARGESTMDSDVDFLVDLDPDRSLFGVVRLIGDLEEPLGCKVDGVTEDAIYWLLRHRILRKARSLRKIPAFPWRISWSASSGSKGMPRREPTSLATGRVKTRFCTASR